MFKQLHSHDGPCHSFKEDPSSCEWVCLVLCQKPSTAFFWNWILDDILVLQNHQLQSESAIGLLDKQSSIHVQGRQVTCSQALEFLSFFYSVCHTHHACTCFFSEKDICLQFFCILQ
jgi:hypothetical protein